MDEWYCRMAGQDFGPMPFAQLYQAAAAGQLPADAWVRFGPQDWIPITSMPQLAGFFQRTPVPAGIGTHVVRRERGNSGASSTSVNIAAHEMTPPQVAVPPGQALPPQGYAVPPQGVAVPPPQGMAVPPPRVSVAPVPVGSAMPAIQPAAGKRPAPAKASPPPPGSQHEETHTKKKKSNPLIPVLALGGVALGLVLVLVVVFVGMGGKKKKPADNDVAAATEPETPIVDSNPGGDSNPPTEEPADNNPTPEKPTKPVPTTSVATTSPEKAPAGDANQAKELALFQKQANWRDPRSVTSLSSKKLKIEFVQAWLAADARGTRVSAANVASETPAGEVPAADPATEAPAEGENGAAPGAASSEPSFVFVQFKITNPGPAPLVYNSWNGPSTDNRALLASDGTALVDFVPPSATGSVTRTTGTVTLAPKQSMTETIVFAAPAGSYGRLQLLLPQTALPILGKGYLGWELHPDLLTAASTELPGAVPPAGERPGASPEPMPEKPAVNNGGQPGSVDDLKRSLEGKDPVMDKPPAKPGPPSVKDLDKQFQEMEETQKKKKDEPAPPPVASP